MCRRFENFSFPFNMNFPKISIIVPSYNQGQYLEETLVSIINQGYSGSELFVTDGGSTDNSVEIIRKYQDNINWWVSEKDNGQSDAINKGLQKATGEIVTWINSDDILLPGTLSKAANHFSTLPDSTGLIHGGTILFNGKTDLETRFTYQEPSREGYLGGMAFSQSSAFFKRKYLLTTGLLIEDLHYGMDYDLFMRLSLVCDFKPVKDVFSKYRLHKESKSIAEGSRFINDWKKSFVNLCKNLSWNNELSILRDTGLFDQELKYHRAFSFQPDPGIIKDINSQKALCFHLGHIIKDLYWNNRIDDAKNLLKMFDGNFPASWVKEDQRLTQVIKKLNMPGFILSSLKKVKRMFK
jgi:glycosyltransferase involved in cell wall biosynthesis